MDSWPECHEFEPSTAEDRSSTGVMFVKSVEAPTSSLWCDVEVVSPSIIPSGNFAELTSSVSCMVLKAKANDRRSSSPLPQ
ncbi:hypothetical protein TNCV_1421851 [Trichonephila clavipes]|nr:hypothetical protein TNCV_1421851 [Trichonephila clavipes]